MRVGTFEEFLEALFEPKDCPGGDWYEDENFEVDNDTLTGWYIRLFKAPDFLFDTFPSEKLERGFAAMINCNFELAAADLVWDRKIDLEQRLLLVSSFYELFSRFFQRLSFWYSTNMWWDAVAYAYECGNAVRGRSDEETRLQDTMFETLVRTLEIDSEACQQAALHGLSHLHHPGGPDAINDYLMRNPNLDPELKEYAAQAALGMIM